MTLSEKVTDALRSAMRDRDTVRLATVRAIRNEILKLSKSGATTEPSDEDIVKIVKGQIKQRQDAIAMFRQGQREDLAVNEEQEIAVLEQFLPAQLDDETLLRLVEQAIAGSNAATVKDMGKAMQAMAALIRKTGKDADNRKVAALIRTQLT